MERVEFVVSEYLARKLVISFQFPEITPLQLADL